MNQPTITAKEFNSLPKKKQSKYRNVVVEAHGKRFDSKKEYGHYLFLLDKQNKGEIIGLECQRKFVMIVNDQIICSYVADFYYVKYSNGVAAVEDVKSSITRKNPVYRLKKKLMKACFNIDIIEI